jgi:hypothetical protein
MTRDEVVKRLYFELYPLLPNYNEMGDRLKRRGLLRIEPPFIEPEREDGLHILTTPHCSLHWSEVAYKFEVALDKLKFPDEVPEEWEDILQTPTVEKRMRGTKTLAEGLLVIVWALHKVQGVTFELTENKFVIHTDIGPRGLDGTKILSKFPQPDIEPVNCMEFLHTPRKVFLASAYLNAVISYVVSNLRHRGVENEEKLVRLYYGLTDREFRKLLVRRRTPTMAVMRRVEEAIFTLPKPFNKILGELYPLYTTRTEIHHLPFAIALKTGENLDPEKRALVFNAIHFLPCMLNDEVRVNKLKF